MLKKIIRTGWMVIAAAAFITASVVWVKDGFIHGKAYIFFILCLLSVIMLLAPGIKSPMRKKRGQRARKPARA